MALENRRVGFIGAGFIGRALGRLTVKSGFEAMLSNSRGPRTLTSAAVSVGSVVGTVAEAAAFSDLIVLAVPFYAIRDLSPDLLRGKIVMDANNHYPHRDGDVPELESRSTTTSEIVAAHFPEARVVKAFNAILERDIEKDARPAGAPDRRALPIAGNDAQAKAIVTAFHDAIGFDVVDAGPLAEGWRFERARPAYCIPFDVVGLKWALADTGPNVKEGSWRT